MPALPARIDAVDAISRAVGVYRDGLSSEEVGARLARDGADEIVTERRCGAESW
jgi:hypothetical protein